MILVLRVPAAELLGHLLAHQLGERIGALRPLDLLVDRHIGRPLGVGDAVDRLARRPHDVADAELPRRLEHVVGRQHVGGEGDVVGRLARRRDGGEVDDAGHLRDALVDHRKGRHRLAEIGDVGAGMKRTSLGSGGLCRSGGGAMSTEVTS